MISPSSPLITRSLVRTVDDMLLDAGESDAGLRSALLALGSLRSLPVPEPGAELAAALLSGPAHQLERHRLLRRHRSSVVGLAVIAGMGLGVTGVAATGSVQDGSSNTSVQQMLSDWSPAWTITGEPVAAPEDAGILVDLQSPADPESGGGAVEDNGSGEAEAYLPGSAGSGSAGPGTSGPGSGHQGTPGAGDKGHGADDASEAVDRGAAGDASGGNEGASAETDAVSGEPAGKADSDAAGAQDKAGKSGARSTVEEDDTSLAKTGKSVSGSTDPGLIWLNKFSR